jgi:hypothetical protein
MEETMLPFASWQGNDPITTPPGNMPETSHGPSFVSTAPVMYMFYSGLGENLWYASSDAPSFPNFIGNFRAKSIDNGGIPKTDFRPASAMLPNGMIHVVYEGKGGSDLWWSWFDGAQTWYGNVPLPFKGYHLRPTLTYFNGQLHLVWHNEVGGSPGHEYLMHSALTAPASLEQQPTVDDWSAPQVLADGADYPSIVAFNKQLYVIARKYPYGANPVPQGFVYAKWDGRTISSSSTLPLHPVVISGSDPKTAEGPTAIVLGDAIIFVYQGEGGENIWYAWMDLDPRGQEQFHGNIQIKTMSSTPMASAVVGLAAFAGKLSVGYKGEGNRIFLTYTQIA